MNPITHQPDPYNYPALNKWDSMSLSVINNDWDGFWTHTKKFYSGRTYNDSLSTQDIQGKKVFKLQELSQSYLDLESFTISQSFQIRIGTLIDQRLEHYTSDSISLNTISQIKTLNFLSQNVSNLTLLASTTIHWIQIISYLKLNCDQSLLQSLYEIPFSMMTLMGRDQRNKHITKQGKSWKSQTLMAQSHVILRTHEELSILILITEMSLMQSSKLNDLQILWILLI